MKISVIIPVYNGEKYLIEALDSVLSALDKVSGEIVIINDGSTDNSDEICRKYCANNSNIVYVYQENSGIVAARNKGIETASGEYICFCDQDDVVHEDIYLNLLQQAEKTGAQMGFCGTKRYVDGELLHNESFSDSVYTGTSISEDVLKPILFFGTIFGRPVSQRWVGTVWKGIFNRHFILSNGIKFRKYVNYEDDLLFFIDAVTNSNCVFSLSYTGYYWRINPESETYNWKYIDDLDIKYEAMWNDILSMAQRVISEENVLSSYKTYQICRLMDQSLTNEGSIYNDISYAKKIANVKRIVYKYGRENLLFYNNIAPEYKRTRVILRLMYLRLFGLAYLLGVKYKKTREIKVRRRI